MVNRGRHKKRDNIKELLKRTSSKRLYTPNALWYKHNMLVNESTVYLDNTVDEKTITKWLNTLKVLGYDKIIIDNLTFII